MQSGMIEASATCRPSMPLTVQVLAHETDKFKIITWRETEV